MTSEQLLKNLEVPKGKIDVVLDTDAFNEIDDQFALAYLLRSGEKLNVRGICAAPFRNERSISPADGMEKSYREILKILALAGRGDLAGKVFQGSRSFLPDETRPVPSEAAAFLADLAGAYSPEWPLYVVSIGAITNLASALLLRPEIKEKIVVVWLGGAGQHMATAEEFNLCQDIAAARVVFDSGVPLVQRPCAGVVDRFVTTRPELEYWLKGKNPLADYLAENTISAAESYAAGKPWSRVIWDVTAVAWLLNDESRFLRSRLIPTPVPEYDGKYRNPPGRQTMRYVYWVNRDRLFEDLFRKLREE